MSDKRKQAQCNDARTVEESSLSPQRAFVVQFRAHCIARLERFTGRVEHIVSGHATNFRTADELVAFMKRVLRTNDSDRATES